MVPFEAQKSSSKHGIIYSSVFNSLLGKVSLDSVASLSNKNVHKKKVFLSRSQYLKLEGNKTFPHEVIG